MGTQGASQHSFTFDALNLLHDGALIAATGAGEVATVAKEVDFGNVDVNSVLNIAYTKHDLVVDIRAMETATGDETYTLVYQLGTVSGFGSGVIVNKAALSYGLAGGLATSGADNTADGALGRSVIGVDNEFEGTTFRFARLFVVVVGTIATGIAPFVFLAEKK